jgi:hypothetical protein
MTALASLAAGNTQATLLSLSRLYKLPIFQALATWFHFPDHYAIVRIVPVVSEELNFTEKVSPIASVKPEP